MHAWGKIVRSLQASNAVTDETLRQLLFEKVSSPKALAEDVAHYQRKPPGRSDRSYIFLRQSMDRHMERLQEKKVKDQQINYFKNISSSLYHKVAALEQDLLMKGIALKGRQILWLL